MQRPSREAHRPALRIKKPPLRIQPTTLWDYPSQHYGENVQGDPNYAGATPSYIIWNLLQRYTKERDLVVDPCAGSGTTLDVARDLNRKALAYDVHPTRKDIFRVDARKLPPELTGKVDFVFIDPPYSTHIDYGPDPRDIGKLDAAHGKGFFPLGFELFQRLLARGFEPIDIISVVRHNKTLEMGNYRKAADEGN